MLPASRAAMVPVFMATPTSACASAGASLVPSPHIATSLPLACSSRISLSLASGVAWARKSSTPASAAIAAAVSALSPVIITVRMPIRRSSAKRSRMPPLTMSLRWTRPSTCAVAGHGQRRAAALGDASRRPRCSSARDAAALALTHSRRSRPPRPCGSRAPSTSTPLMRVWAVKGTNSRVQRRHLARRACRTSPWPARRSSGPRASRRRSEASCAASASSRSVDARHRR